MSRKQRKYFGRKASRPSHKFYFRRSTAGKSSLSVEKAAIGAAATTFVEPWFDQLVNSFTGGNQMLDDAAKVALGYYLAKKQSGYMKGVGYAMLMFGTRNLVSGFAGGFLGNKTTSVAGDVVVG